MTKSAAGLSTAESNPNILRLYEGQIIGQKKMQGLPNRKKRKPGLRYLQEKSQAQTTPGITEARS
jgi:hypothetical protein